MRGHGSRRGGWGEGVPFPFGQALSSRKAARWRARDEERRALALTDGRLAEHIPYVADIPCANSDAPGSSGRERIRL